MRAGFTVDDKKTIFFLFSVVMNNPLNLRILSSYCIVHVSRLTDHFSGGNLIVSCHDVSVNVGHHFGWNVAEATATTGGGQLEQ